MTAPFLRRTHRLLAGALVVFAATWLPQAHADTPSAAVASGVAVVTIGGEVSTPLHLDAAALAKKPRISVEASDHGKPGTWEGVRLIDLLHDAGLPTGEALRGKALALYVRISAADGYRAVYALAELDPGFRDAPVILADRHDGKPLDAKEGPLRIVAVGEKRPARWVRQVVAIDVLRAPDTGR
jgi:DMSO/TMAO reductase YedYZ molybdopterin-dependent catalytic subunit